MIKNKPIQSLVSFIAIMVAMINGLMFFIGVHTLHFDAKIHWTILASLFVVVLNYLFIKWLLDKYIFDKIKVL